MRWRDRTSEVAWMRAVPTPLISGTLPRTWSGLRIRLPRKLNCRWTTSLCLLPNTKEFVKLWIDHYCKVLIAFQWKQRLVNIITLLVGELKSSTDKNEILSFDESCPDGSIEQKKIKNLYFIGDLMCQRHYRVWQRDLLQSSCLFRSRVKDWAIDRFLTAFLNWLTQKWMLSWNRIVIQFLNVTTQS